MVAASTAVACPNDYDYVYRNYRSFLYGVVYHSGVPHYSVEDASDEIFIRMLNQDGLGRFNGSISDSTSKTKAYLASYFSLGARAELSRIRTRDHRSVALDTLPDLEDDTDLPSTDWDLLDMLLSITSGDARRFIEVAAQNQSYQKARAALAAEGWESRRIRRAVREARATVRQLCTSR